MKPIRETLVLAVEALEEMLAAERATNRPPTTVMEAEAKLDRIRSASKQADSALSDIRAAIEVLDKAEPVAALHRTQSNVIECFYHGSLCPIDGNHLHAEFVNALPYNRSVSLYTTPQPCSQCAEKDRRIAELEMKKAASIDSDTLAPTIIARMEQMTNAERVELIAELSGPRPLAAEGSRSNAGLCVKR